MMLPKIILKGAVCIIVKTGVIIADDSFNDKLETRSRQKKKMWTKYIMHFLRMMIISYSPTSPSILLSLQVSPLLPWKYILISIWGLLTVSSHHLLWFSKSKLWQCQNVLVYYGVSIMSLHMLSFKSEWVFTLFFQCALLPLSHCVSFYLFLLLLIPSHCSCFHRSKPYNSDCAEEYIPCRDNCLQGVDIDLVIVGRQVAKSTFIP